MPRRLSLDQVFRLQETRTVSNDWVVRYANRHLQLERQTPLPPARSTVQVFEDATGQIEIRYRDRIMRWREIPSPVPADRREAAPAPRPSPPKPARRPGPNPDHPWHHTVEQYYEDQQVARDRRAWERVQP